MSDNVNSRPSIKNVGEFKLINSLTRNFKYSKNVIKGVGDDTAVLQLTKTHSLLSTTDMLVEGVHFTKQASAKDVAHKALACSISDVAAMGGVPTSAVISLGLPKNTSQQYVKDLYQGFIKTAAEFQLDLIGGDMSQSRQLVINVALLGQARKQQIVYRDGAQEGDTIFVTGPLGGSFKSHRHLTFTPRVKESQYLINDIKPTSMIDITDGLVADLNHICEQSNCGAVLFKEQIPRNQNASLKQACYDGEDFELLFTVSEKKLRKMQAQKKFPFYEIGRIAHLKHKIHLVVKNGLSTQMRIKGYEHF